MADHRTLLELVRTQNVLVCVGSGGVGKTTVSAAIAMHAAQLGRTACVLTIDPARRLANALGLNQLGNRPTRVEDARFDAAGVPRPSGRLFAMMLDTKRTWDDLVHRFAPSDEQAKRHSCQSLLSEHLGSVGRLTGIHGDGEALRTARIGRL
jgi:anion-transporting  ArsA/GET3 family ATPase